MLYRRPHHVDPIPLPHDLRRPDGGALDAAGLYALCQEATVADSPVPISISKGSSDAAGPAGAIASRLRAMEKVGLGLKEAALEKGRPVEGPCGARRDRRLHRVLRFVDGGAARGGRCV